MADVTLEDYRAQQGSVMTRLELTELVTISATSRTARCPPPDGMAPN